MAFRFDRDPNDFTRIARGLLRSEQLEGMALMAKTKTHFEKVPLKVAKKIAEKEALTTGRQDQGSTKR